MKKWLSIFVVLQLSISACTQHRKIEKPASAGISTLAGSWKLFSLTAPGKNFDTLFPTKKPNLPLDLMNHKINGNAGCNSYWGKFSGDEVNIRFEEPIASTRMMCADGIHGEQIYFEVLKKVNHYSVQNDTLELMEDNTNVMLFIKN